MASKKKEELLQPEMQTQAQPAAQSTYSAEGLNSRADVEKAMANVSYRPGQQVTDAADALKQWQQNRPADYQSSYQDKINSLLGQLLERENFQYSYTRDPLYRQYEQLYTQNAHNASADAAAQAAALTGGYGSSYATSAAQQAYQQQIGGLASAIPTLYNLALDTYQSGGEELVNRLDQLNGQEQNAQTLLETFPDSGRTGYLLRRTFDEVTQVVDELYDELSVSAFRPKFCELEFSARGALPGVAFSGKRCRGVVEGFVDRVDVWQSGGRPYVRVVDYKTGKKSFDYTNVLHGRGLQMLLYLFALVRQGGHLLHGEPLPAGVLYFPARIERVSVRDRLAQAEIEKERRKQLRRSGVLLNSDPVLEAMEPCGGSPRFLPYALDKEGRKTGDLASFAQLAQLERFVFRTVAALGDELADGHIDPDPCIRDAKDSAYSEVCAGHEQPRWLKKITAEEFWQTLERREHG